MRRKKRVSLGGGGSRRRKWRRNLKTPIVQLKTMRRLGRKSKLVVSASEVLRKAKAASKQAVHGHCKIAIEHMGTAEELLGHIKPGKTHSKLIRVIARESHIVRNNCF